MIPSSEANLTADSHGRTSHIEDTDRDLSPPQTQGCRKQPKSPKSPSPDRRKQKAKEKRQWEKLARRQLHKVAQWPERRFSASPGPDSFYGRLMMRGRIDACEFAKSVYKTPDLSTRVFWADGAYGNDGRAGAAVVYRPDPRVDEWTHRGYAVSGLQHSQELELFAIGAALRLAVLEAETTLCSSVYSQQSSPLSPSSSQSSSTLARSPITAVTVFTDCPWSSVSETTAHLVKLVVRLSQQLRGAGVQVEVHWAPGHMSSPIPGQKQADLVARAATKLQAPLATRAAEQSADGTVLMVGVSYLGCSLPEAEDDLLGDSSL